MITELNRSFIIMGLTGLLVLSCESEMKTDIKNCNDGDHYACINLANAAKKNT